MSIGKAPAFVDLVDEIWFMIILALPLEDIGRFSQVSKRFYKISSDWYLWKTLFHLHHPTAQSTLSLQETIHNINYKETYKALHSQWELVKTSSLHSDEVLHGTWSPDGNYFCSVSRDQYAIVFSLDDIQNESLGDSCLFHLKHSSDTGRVSFSFNSELLLTATVSEMNRTYHLQSFIYITSVKEQKTLLQLPSASFDTFPCWLGDTKLLYNSELNYIGNENSSFTQTFSIVDFRDMEVINNGSTPKLYMKFKLENLYNHFHLSAISKDGKVFVTTTGITPVIADQLWIIDIPTPEELENENENEPLGSGELNIPKLQPRQIIPEGGFILGVQISPNGKYLACCVRNYTQPENVVPKNPNSEGAFIYPPVETQVTTQLYNLETGKLICTLGGCVGFSDVEKIFLILPEFSSCSRFLCCGSEDGTVRIWSTEFGILLTTLSAHSNVVNFCAWHPQLPLFVTGSDDNSLKAWAVRDQTSPLFSATWKDNP